MINGKNVLQHPLQDVARNMKIKRSEDAAEFPSCEQGGQDIGVIFADDGHDRLGAIFLMKIKSKSGRDGIEVAIGPGFVTTLETIMFNARPG